VREIYDRILYLTELLKLLL